MQLLFGVDLNITKLFIYFYSMIIKDSQRHQGLRNQLVTEIKAKGMSQANIQKLSQELQQKEQILSQRLQFEQQQIAQESQAQNDSLIKKIKDFVKDYGTKNGYSYILGSNEGGSVMFGKEESDLTQTLLDLLNAAYKKD